MDIFQTRWPVLLFARSHLTGGKTKNHKLTKSKELENRLWTEYRYNFGMFFYGLV